MSAIARAFPPTVKSRGDLYFLHIDAAVSLARQSTAIGRKYDTNESEMVTDSDRSAYRACVISTLFTTVAFLEAAINAIFADAVESIPEKDRTEKDGSISVKDTNITRSGIVVSLSPKTIKRLAQVWLRQRKITSYDSFPHFAKFLDRRKKDGYNNVERWAVLDKYQAALFLNKKSPFGYSLKRQAVYALLDLRHYLTHPKPEWVILAGPEGASLGPEKERSATLERRVKALIESDPLRPVAGYPHERMFLSSAFPHNCLSSTLARIAVRSALEFDTVFCNWMGIENVQSKYPQLARDIRLVI